MGARRWTLLAVGTLACGGTPPAASPGPAGGAILLYEPTADSADLLGRRVHVTEDGAWTIADARLPGCRLSFLPPSSGASLAGRVRLEALASLASDYRTLVRRQLREGRPSLAELAIDAGMELRADVEEGCGDAVIEGVFVGQGRRALRSEGTEPEALVWGEPRAYALRVRRNASGSGALQVLPAGPLEFIEGQAIELALRASADAFLAVVHLDTAGRAEVLWPWREERALFAPAGKPVTVPTARQREEGVVIKAALPVAGMPARGALVVYAFAERADFERFAPRAGASDPDGAAYASFPGSRMGGMDDARWARALVTYRVAPAATPRRSP